MPQGGNIIKTAGVIAEYNPFHNGHAYHLKKTKALTGSGNVIVVMSGNFVQRGEPAIYDKYVRTRCALLNGADLVIELPVFFACAAAGYFASAAVDILNKTGITDTLSFGAEDADISKLSQYAHILCENSAAFNQTVKENLAEGVSYPKAVANAFKAFGLDAAFAGKPNNILAIEYLRALNESNSQITPFAIPRKGAGYHNANIETKYPSATAIRAQILSRETENIKNAVPKNCYEIYFAQSAAHKLDKMSQLLQYKIKTLSAQKISEIANITEGMEKRAVKSAAKNFLIGDIISDVKTKRYTFTKIQRAILHIILNIAQKDLEYYSKRGCRYIRVLGFRKDSAVLPQLIKKSTVPVITNVKNAEKVLNAEDFAVFEKEITASDIYYLTNGLPRPKNYEYHAPMVII
ncbi:MAG: nucleotidyltransferase [Clostridiales bacterium]|nr:nucleotidyltransferase [Clostridiales bacterium]